MDAEIFTGGFNAVVTEHFFNFKNRPSRFQQILGIGVPQPVSGGVNACAAKGFRYTLTDDTGTCG
jgi:hypothetical protein